MYQTTLLFTTLSFIASIAIADESTANREFFEQRIRPVLVKYCYECHSAASASLEAGLQLDYRGGLLRGGETGPAIVVGQPLKSKLITALKYEALQMPPDGKLPDSIVRDFERWIEQGAFDPRESPPSPASAANESWKAKLNERSRWWSLQRPAEVLIPPMDHVANESDSWQKETVDRFIRHKQMEVGLYPAPTAPPEVLLRRLSFVLTGLPPTPSQVSEFEQKWRVDADTAYTQLVDSMLESPHFGERFARHWMDVIHYTDTYGYEWDIAAKGSYEFRDYLIRAFNSDIGFDQFIREHIAGDLLPEPRLNLQQGINESLIGPMFFHFGERRHGSSLDFAGVHQEMIDSQIDAFSKTFLGMTVACARCHDHKLDAVSQNDYYALAGMFMTPRWTTRSIDTSDKYASSLKQLIDIRETIREKIAALWSRHLDEHPLELSRLLTDDRTGDKIESPAFPLVHLLTDIEWQLRPIQTATAQQPDTTLTLENDGFTILASSSLVPEKDSYVIVAKAAAGTVSDLKLEALTHPSLGTNGPGRTPHGNFVLSFIRIQVTPDGSDQAIDVPILSAKADYEQPNYPISAALTPAQDGWGVGLGGNVNRSALFKFAKPVELPQGGQWKVTLEFNLGSGHILGRFRLATGSASLDSNSDSQMVQQKWSKLKEQWQSERARRLEHNRRFTSLTDFSTRQLPSPFITDGVGIDYGWSRECTPQIALEGDSILASILHRGIHTHALTPKLPGAIRLPEPEHFPQKHISLQLSGGEWGGYRTVPQNAFLNEGPQFFDPNAPRTWFTVSTVPLRYGVTRVLTEISTPDLNANFPPRTGVARMGNTPLSNDDRGYDKRGWFSITSAVAHDQPGHPLDELACFESLYESPAPTSNSEIQTHISKWIRDAILRFANDQAKPGDAILLQWLLQKNLLPNTLSQEADLRSAVEHYREVEASIEFGRTVNSMDERGLQPIDYRLNIRGDVHNEGDHVPRGFLEVFADRPNVANTQSGRLELAAYLSDSRNPLAARVYVNRVWQWIFGTGIVDTPSDFGKLGGQPSHPELLDWLTLRFITEGWSTKKLVRRLVLSQTFRQSGKISASAIEKDPANRLLHHYPTRRLEAEAVRDSILAVSQKLDRSLFGRPIRPHRSAQDSQKRLFSGPIDGMGRRSLYLELSVMQPPEFLVGFNLPDLKTSVGRRDITNVPAQALILMNHSFVTEMSRYWGQQLAGSSLNSEERIAQMFVAAYGRTPSKTEIDRWLKMAKEISKPSADLNQDAEVWGTLAHAIFNSKEFLYYR
jgi:hypothetical protein